MKFGISQGVTRKEDDAFLRGSGRYVADLVPPGACRAVLLRSPHAHARLDRLDAEAARAMPGVRLILTAADIAELGPLPCVGMPPGVRADVPENPILVRDIVRHVGDAIAFVVADTVDQAKDAAEAIVVEWTPLPHIVDAVAALEPGAPPVWPDRGGNLVYRADARRGSKDCGGVRRRGADGLADARQSAARRQLSRYARGLGRVRRGERELHADARQPGRPYAAGRARTSGAAHPRRPAAGHHPGCRRRLRHENISLSRICARRGRGAAARPAGRLDRRPHASISSPTRKAATTSRPRSSRSTRRGGFSRSRSISVCDMGAYLSFFAPFIPYVGAGMLPGVYDIPTLLHPHQRRPSPTPCRSTPIAAPAGRRRPM